MRETGQVNLPADPELDAELAQMAEEVPPMPAGFHAKWMGAVTAEAQKTTAEAGEKAPKAAVSMTWLTRIFSIAAVFVFLIGGTILYRNSRKDMAGTLLRAEEKGAAEMTAEVAAAGAAPEAGEEEEAAGAAETEEAAADAAEAVSGAAEVQPLLAMKAAESAGIVMNDYEAGFAGEAPKAASEAMMDEAADLYDAEADYGPAEEYAAEKATEATGAPAPLATGMPVQPDPAPEEEPGKEHEGAGKEDSFLQQAGDFLADMGGFLLAAMPYLLVLAVPAAAALIIRYRKK